jgi:hypothetical protein
MDPKETDSGTPILTGVGAVATGPPAASSAERFVVKGCLYLVIASVVMWMI